MTKQSQLAATTNAATTGYKNPGFASAAQNGGVRVDFCQEGREERERRKKKDDGADDVGVLVNWAVPVGHEPTAHAIALVTQGSSSTGPPSIH